MYCSAPARLRYKAGSLNDSLPVLKNCKPPTMGVHIGFSPSIFARCRTPRVYFDWESTKLCQYNALQLPEPSVSRDEHFFLFQGTRKPIKDLYTFRKRNGISSTSKVRILAAHINLFVQTFMTKSSSRLDLGMLEILFRLIFNWQDQGLTMLYGKRRHKAYMGLSNMNNSTSISVKTLRTWLNFVDNMQMNTRKIKYAFVSLRRNFCVIYWTIWIHWLHSIAHCNY